MAVDELMNSIVISLTDHSAKLAEAIFDEENLVGERDADLIKMIETFRDSDIEGVDLIEYYEELKSKADTLPVLDISHYRDNYLYKEGDISCESLLTMIGEIREANKSSAEVEEIASFKHKETNVHTISAISREKAWFTYQDEEEFTLINKDGRSIKSVKKETPTHSFLYQNDAFLLANYDEKNILKVDMHGDSSIWKDTSPLRAYLIGEALNKNVLVSLVDEASGIRSDISQRKVQMVAPSGQFLQAYELDNDGNSSKLICPGRVIQNFNSDVCVVNQYQVSNEDWRGNICAFYEDGGLKFVYKGHGKEFNPFGLNCDSMCNILCVNYVDESVHMVSSDGAFLKYLFTRDTCVPRPSTLTLHRGVLWVGSWKGEVRVYRYSQ